MRENPWGEPDPAALEAVAAMAQGGASRSGAKATGDPAPGRGRGQAATPRIAPTAAASTNGHEHDEACGPGGADCGPGATGCHIGDLFRLLGKTYVMDILYVFNSEPGPRRFVELQTRLEMSPNTLSDRLKELTDHGLLTRTAYNEIPPRVEYEATPKAKDLKEVFKHLGRWARRHDLKPVAVAATTAGNN